MKYNKSKIITELKHRISLCLCAFVPLCLICLSGCGQQQTTTNNAIAAETNEISRTMQAAEKVLIKMHFDIAKADYGKGYIRTRPLAGAQFFEFWRSDNVGMDNQLLSNMHSIRRIVELNISNSDGTMNTDCKVHVQRLSIPQRKISSSSQAFQTFTRSSLSFQRLELYPEQEKDMAWLELDRDTELETEILKRLSSTMDKKYSKIQSEVQTSGEEL
ncbi:MAG: hypothetical protein JXA96_03330 [Sedimentisphaerales bacterium]|nr:hypothetical protein [Sedimentisphaerales bacterium]